MQEIKIDRALQIEGWMSLEELTWLAQQAQTRQCIVEIGSYLGRSTRALADNCPGLVYALDDFRGPRDADVPDDVRSRIWKLYLANTTGCPRLVTLPGDHRRPPSGLNPDMVFIDGSHEYEDVLFDILYWQGELLPGGLMCGHDYDENWPGVTRAVDEVYPNRVRRVDGTRIWEVIA